MSLPFLVAVSPAHVCDPGIPIAATRAGAVGLLDLGLFVAPAARRDAVGRLVARARGDAWGVRCDLLEAAGQLPDILESCGIAGTGGLPILLVAGAPEGDGEAFAAFMAGCLAVAKRAARAVYLEVYSPGQAVVAERAGFDGVLLKGHEAGGRVGSLSTFLLLQHVHGRLGIPCWVQGGIGPHTAAAARLAGASGVVLGEQLWLTRESPLTPRDRDAIRPLDGSETACLGDERGRFRFLARAARSRLQELDRQLTTGAAWPETLVAALRTDASPTADSGAALVPAGQDVGMAGRLAERHVSVAGVVRAFDRGIAACLEAAPRQRALAAGGPWAKAHGTRYPIAQGPMTRVSDVAPFCRDVAAAGALPFLALALLRAPAIRGLLTAAKAEAGGRPWGVGMLGFVPADLRREQLAEVLANPPAFALIAGGRPAQARELEEQGIPTYLHVPSRGLLEAFLADGARRFVLEGRECGGHVGPQSSFALWQSAIDTLLDAKITDPANVHVLFAGGIHDDLSAALVATAAAPLVERGMNIGVLMGTAYLFTREAVASGAIAEEFQRQALACTSTALVESGVGHATRCAITPFVEDFTARKRKLVAGGASPQDVRGVMEVFNVGRLRIAAKGVARRSMLAAEPMRSGSERDRIGRDVAAELAHDPGDLVTVDLETQRRMGMYMIGEIATLRDRVVSVAELHAQVADGGAATLARLASTVAAPPSAPPPEGEPLAIVGIGCVFPDAPDLRAYWENLVRGHDAVREIPADRWSAEQYYSADRFARDMVYSKWGGLLPEMKFDPLAHQIPPASLFAIEPVQMLALDAAGAALADAGYDRGDFPRERTSVVIAAAGMHELAMRYGIRTMMRQFLTRATLLTDAQRQQIIDEMNAELPEWTEDSFPGILTNVIAGRISNRFDLGGPNFTVDAACASSLAALQTAAAQLRAGLCDAAVVGAADGNSSAFCYMCFAKTHALSPDGHSKAFDESADGIGLGEGVAALVVKRLRDAERDGDSIYAVIRGIGASSDGRNRSLTAPAAEGQRLALERAYADAGVSPASVSLVEAHGTGTTVGDRVECEVLGGVLAAAGAPPGSVAIGSVKSMIGHAKTAAGLAGVVKTALALKHRVLPPTIGVKTPNAGLRTAGSPLYVNTENRPWIVAGEHRPRRAAVSAFGFGGTNFHAVLEEHDGDEHGAAGIDFNPRPCELFAWRRASREELVRAVGEFQGLIDGMPDTGLPALAAAAWHDEAARPRDSGDGSRLAIVATSVADLRQRLEAVVRDLPGAGRIDDAVAFYAEGPATRPEEVCFLYPGQGSQSVNMLRDLVVGNPDLHHLFEAADEEVRDILERPLSSFVYPPPVFDGGESRLRDAVNATQVAQPAMAVADLFCHELLGRYGIEPAMVAGHSFGEYVALAAAGVVSARGLFRLSALRGRAAYRAGIEAGGGMAAVGASLEATVAALAELGIEAHPANVNAPLQTVIGGTAEAIDAAVKRLPTKRISARRIPVTAAFHTPLLAAATCELGEHLAATDFRPPTRLVFSNTTGGIYPERVEEIRDLLRRHLVEPVRFLDQVRAMHDRGARVFIEAGPGSVLTNLTVRILDGRPFAALAAAPNGQPGWQAWGSLLGRLWSLGLPVRLERWFAHRRLPEGGVEEIVRRQRERTAGRPTDWIVNSSVATPVSGITQRRPATPSLTGAPAATPAPAASPAAAEPTPVPAASPAPRHVAPPAEPMPATPVPVHSAHRPAPSQSQGAAMIDMSNDDRNGHEAAPHAGILEAQQRLMAQWLELQMRHVEVSGRFLDSNERIVLACLNGTVAAGDISAAVRPAALRAPVSRTATPPRPAPAPNAAGPGPATPAPARPGVSLPSRPVTPLAARTMPANGGNGHQQAVRPEPAATRASPSPVAKPAAVTEAAPDAPPPTEQFRRDLIAAVAERTGYPVEMLKEDALLEADLGIDSIKTVEIFGSLTQYHRFMPGGGGLDEELLGEFAQLKTLGDIIAMYDRGRAGGATAAKPVERPLPATNGAAAVTNGTVPATNGSVAPVNGATPAVNGSHPALNGSHPTLNGSHPAMNGSHAALNGNTATPSVNGASEAESQALERLEVRAVPAPTDAGGEKKNSLLTTSS